MMELNARLLWARKGRDVQVDITVVAVILAHLARFLPIPSTEKGYEMLAPERSM